MKIDGTAWLGKWYLLPACIGMILMIYAVCTLIELVRQGIFYIRESFWMKIDGTAWLGKWYLLPACIGMILMIYAVCTLIELVRQGIFYRFEYSERISGFFYGLDEKLRRIWHGMPQEDKNRKLRQK